MRKLAILAVLIVLALYLALAHHSQTRYDVPRYEVVELDILGAASLSQWQDERYSDERYERLNALAGRQYQPAKTLRANGRTWTTETVLGEDDYRALVAAGMTELTVRDPSAVHAFVNLHLRLRQDVVENGQVIGRAGWAIDKALVDRALAADRETLPVVGAGAVVGFNATVYMVILIFIGLALALQEVFWNPVLVHMDRRRTQLEGGVERARENEKRAEAMETERQEKLRDLHHAYQGHLRTAYREAMTEANGMVARTVAQMNQEHQEALQELGTAAQSAREELEAEIPALAETIAQAAAQKRQTGT